MKVAFFGAHTDDEIICAGTLHRLARAGHEVSVVTMGPAGTQEDPRGGLDACAVVRPEWERAMKLIGVPEKRRRLVGKWDTVSLHDRSQEVADVLFDFCERERPHVVFTLSPEDENPAHAVVGVQTERVTRGRVPTTIRCQYPWNHSIGRPNLYVKLAPEDLEVKRQVIRAYQSQTFRYDYEGMLMRYAEADGLSVKAAVAEKFEVVRAVLEL